MQLRRFRISVMLQGLPAIVRASEVISGQLLQIAVSLAYEECCIHLLDSSVEIGAATCFYREVGHFPPKPHVRQICLHRVKDRLWPGKSRKKRPVVMQQWLAVFRGNPSTL